MIDQFDFVNEMLSIDMEGAVRIDPEECKRLHGDIKAAIKRVQNSTREPYRKNKDIGEPTDKHWHEFANQKRNPNQEPPGYMVETSRTNSKQFAQNLHKEINNLVASNKYKTVHPKMEFHGDGKGFNVSIYSK